MALALSSLLLGLLCEAPELGARKGEEDMQWLWQQGQGRGEGSGAGRVEDQGRSNPDKTTRTKRVLNCFQELNS